jgi:uncharacterized membrane protein
MKGKLKEWFKAAVLFLIGGGLYFCLEILFRGYSHWTMIICGGLCFVLIGCLNEYMDFDMSLVSQMFHSTLVVTSVEFIFGLVLNCFLGLDIWDYSNMPGNILGQICPQFMLLWFFLSAVAIVLDDVIRWKLFGEEKPHYHIFRSDCYDD